AVMYVSRYPLSLVLGRIGGQTVHQVDILNDRTNVFDNLGEELQIGLVETTLLGDYEEPPGGFSAISNGYTHERLRTKHVCHRFAVVLARSAALTRGCVVGVIGA